MDTVKASISPGYRWRLILITVMMLGFGAYCVYDWQIGYPRLQEIGETYKALKESNPDDYPERWREIAAERGWSDRPPTKFKSDQDIFTQFLMAVLICPLGLFFAFKFVKENGRWVAMDDSGITASGGHQVPWEAIKRLDETRWRTKGIAWLHYETPDGAERRVLLDDFKSQRDPVVAIVKRVQGLLNPEEEAADQDTGEVADGASADEGLAADQEPGEERQTTAV